MPIGWEDFGAKLTAARRSLWISFVTCKFTMQNQQREKDGKKSLHQIVTRARPQLHKSVNSSENAYLFSVALNLIATEPW